MEWRAADRDQAPLIPKLFSLQLERDADREPDVTRTADGIFLGVLTSLDQGNARIPLDIVEVKGLAVRLEARAPTSAPQMCR